MEFIDLIPQTLYALILYFSSINTTIGASLSESHINGTSLPALYIFIYLFIWYVRHAK
jgi:hypothetical protein